MAPANGPGGDCANAPSRTSGLSNIALGVALFAYICFWGVGGFLAVVLGFSARSEIARSEGRLRGRRRATVAIVLGVVNVAGALALAVQAARTLERWTRTTPRPSPSLTHPAPPSPPKSRHFTPPAARRATAPSRCPARSTREPSSRSSGA